MKVLMAVIMQNGLRIQQLQLMVVLKQKKIEEEELKEENCHKPLFSTKSFLLFFSCSIYSVGKSFTLVSQA